MLVVDRQSPGRGGLSQRHRREVKVECLQLSGWKLRITIQYCARLTRIEGNNGREGRILQCFVDTQQLRLACASERGVPVGLAIAVDIRGL